MFSTPREAIQQWTSLEVQAMMLMRLRSELGRPSRIGKFDGLLYDIQDRLESIRDQQNLILNQCQIMWKSEPDRE